MMPFSVLRFAGALVGLGLWSASSFAAGHSIQAPAPSSSREKPAVVRFTYDDPGLQPAQYVITVAEDGSGHYLSKRGAAKDGSRFSPQPQDRSIHVSAPTVQQIFAAARRAKFFAIKCENGGKHVAFEGAKTLEYDGPDGSGRCAYNWSGNKQIEKLTSIFEGISFTLVEGGKLKLQDQYFKLALDPEIQALVEAARQGNALEIENIDPVLERIAGDSRNLDRVRRDARELLAAGSGATESKQAGN